MDTEKIKKTYTEEETKELASITSYIIWSGLLRGTFSQTFDIAYEFALEFMEMYPPDTEWGCERDDTLEYDETIEAFVKQKLKSRQYLLQ